MQPPILKKSTAAQTLVASSIFIDLVGFSKLPTSTQVFAKDRFNATLRQALSELGESNYWVRDLGEGTLIICPNSPEHALFLALKVHQEFLSFEAGPGLSKLELRMGLNLGVLKTNVDLEGRANYLGDGINATQRLIDFAEPGQMLVSRAFADAVAYLHADYATLFSAPQARQDKHGRTHEVFAVEHSVQTLARLGEELRESQLSLTPASSPQIPASASTSLPALPVNLTEHTVTIIRNWFIPFNAVFFTVGVVWTGFQRFGLSGSRAQLIGVTVMAVGSALWLVAHRMSGRLQIAASRQRTAGAIGFLLVAVGSMVTATAWISTYLQEPPSRASAPPRSAGSPLSVGPPDNAGLSAGEELLPPTRSVEPPVAAPPVAAQQPAKSSTPVAIAATVVSTPPRVRPPANAEPVSSPAPPSAADSARCTNLLNKSALGSSISTAEKQEIAQSCR